MNMEYKHPPWTGRLFRALLEAAAICLPPVPPGLFLTTELDFRSSSNMWCLFQDLPNPQVPPAKRSSRGFIQCSLMPGGAPRAPSILATLLGVSVSRPPTFLMAGVAVASPVLDGHRLSQTGRASTGELGRPGTEGCFPRWSHRAGETGLQRNSQRS